MSNEMVQMSLGAEALKPRRHFRALVLTLLASAVIASAQAVATSTGAQAAGVGTGRAVVHVDAKTASVAKVGKDRYVLIMPLDTSGQWMGERIDGRGRERILVGDFHGRGLAMSWNDLMHSDARAAATLVWTEQGEVAVAPVRIHRPKVTALGIVFDVRSRVTLPKRLKNVEIHVGRAPLERSAKRQFPQTQTATVVDTLTIATYNPTAAVADVTIYDSDAPGVPCFDQVLTPTATVATVTAMTCAGITVMDADGSPSGEPYGVYATFPETSNDGGNQSTQGTALFSLVVTPPGAYPYTYCHAFEWSAPPPS